MKHVVYSLLLFALAACGGNKNDVPANQLASNDFESVEGWTGDSSPASLTKDKSHSGRYAVRVGPGVDFSMGYANVLNLVSAVRFQKIKVHAWVWIPDRNATASLVTQVTNPADGNKAIMWQGMDLVAKAKKFSKWVEIEQEYTLPETATANSKLYCYMWRGSSPSSVYLDDLQILKVE